MARWWDKPVRLTFVVSALGVVGVGCSSSKAAPTRTSVPAPTTSPATTAAPSSSPSTAPSTAPPTTLTPVPAGEVADCVAYVQFGAFTRNALLTAMWDHADHDVDKLRAQCEQLGRDQPAALATMSTNWKAIQAATSTTVRPKATPTTKATTVPVTTVRAPTTTAAAPPPTT